MGTDSIRVKDWQKEVLEKITEELDQSNTMSNAMTEIMKWYALQLHATCGEKDEELWEEWDENPKKLLLKLIPKYKEWTRTRIEKAREEKNE